MSSRSGPLAGVRVLEMGRLIAAPFCGQVLGDLGADVIKVERIGAGDDIRTYGPPFLRDDDSPGGSSSYFLAHNRNKRSIAVDFSKPEGAQLVRDLAAKSHVLIENYKVGSLKRYGLDAESVRKLNEAIIYLSVSGFGQDGPYASRPATDVALQGISGFMSLTGEADGRPQKAGVHIVDMFTGLYAAIGIISALYESSKGGGDGDWVRVSLLDCSMSMMGFAAVWNQLAGEPPKRRGNDASGTYPSGVFACRDGDILFQAGKDADFVKLCNLLKAPELLTDPRFAQRAGRVANNRELAPLLEHATRQWDRSALYEALVGAGIICGAINDIADAMADPQVAVSEILVNAGHPEMPGLQVLAPPIRFDNVAREVRRPPPRVGEHTAEVLSELLDLDSACIAELSGRGVVGLFEGSPKVAAAAV